MRKLAKNPTPDRLLTQHQSLTEAYLKAPADAKTTPWKRPYILEALRVETDAKCAYCESRVDAVSYLHVEHILPKAVFPQRVVDWSNLTLACPRCNINKDDYFDQDCPLLNPYVDDPAQHLLFEGDMILAKPGNLRAEATVVQLKLGRLELRDQRVKALSDLHKLLHSLALARAPLRAAIEQMVEMALDDSVEYAATLQAFAARVGFARSASSAAVGPTSIQGTC